MKKIIKSTAIILATFLIASCSNKNEEIFLRLNDTIGETYSIVSKTDAKSGSLMSMNTYTEVSFKPIAFNDSIYTYETKLIKVKSEANMGGDIDRYDSSMDIDLMTEDERSMHSKYMPDLSTTYNVQMNTRGEIIKSFYTSSGPKMDEELIGISSFQIKFPEEKVYVGYSWKNEVMNSLIKKNNKLTYTIKEITEKEIIIEVLTIIPAYAGLLKEGKTHGTFILDRNTCNLINATIKMKLQMGGNSVTTYTRK